MLEKSALSGKGARRYPDARLAPACWIPPERPGMMRVRRNGVLLASGTLFTMHRASPSLLGVGCALTLLLSCFRAVLFQGQQFAYRDAGHFYYPLYLRVQQEWAAGRWPLWDPWQNAGMPPARHADGRRLLPGQVLYAVLPYPWATRLYTFAYIVVA